MGIFDVIELRQHIQAIGEYVFYIADVAAQSYENPSQVRSIPICELSPSLDFITDHLKSMSKILDKFDK